MPPGQLEQAVAPASLEKNPPPHGTQKDEPVADCDVPVGQSVHVGLAGIDEYEPAAQNEHEAAPASDEVPVGHGLHDVAALSEKVPALQSVHCAAPGFEKRPAAHCVQNDDPASDAKVPALHNGHIAAPTTAFEVPGLQNEQLPAPGIDE